MRQPSQQLRRDLQEMTADVYRFKRAMAGYRPAVGDYDREILIEIAAYRLLWKFHKETECGRDGMHWAECDALIQRLGYASWEAWEYLVTHIDLGE